MQSRGLFNVMRYLSMRARERAVRIKTTWERSSLAIHGGNEASLFICKPEAETFLILHVR